MPPSAPPILLHKLSDRRNARRRCQTRRLQSSRLMFAPPRSTRQNSHVHSSTHHSGKGTDYHPKTNRGTSRPLLQCSRHSRGRWRDRSDRHRRSLKRIGSHNSRQTDAGEGMLRCAMRRHRHQPEANTRHWLASSHLSPTPQEQTQSSIPLSVKRGQPQ